MVDNEKPNKSKPQNLRASMSQKSTEIKVDNEEIHSYIGGKDLDVKELSSQSEESRDDSKIEKDNWCKICDKTFSASYSLSKHVRNVHEEAKSYVVCNLCNKQFARNDYLQKHIRTHVKRDQ